MGFIQKLFFFSNLKDLAYLVQNIVFILDEGTN